MDNIRDGLWQQGSYAVTQLVLDLSYPQILEKELSKIILDMSKALVSYKNLRKITVRAPYAAMDGSQVQRIMELDAPFNELSIDVWAFHTPQQHMWTARKLKSLEITISDGVAFPNSINHMLCGLKHDQENMHHLSVLNDTPHIAIIPKSLLPKVDTSNFMGVEIATPIWWFATDKPMRL